jgi:AcrR family transcriptional regulator
VRLRELKKEQTRQLIAETAWRLFADRGFDAVTVAEVAREAQVATATVFNYFATKEDLFFSRLDEFEARLVEAVAGRRDGEPAMAAFQRYVGQAGGLLGRAAAGDEEAVERLRTIHRTIAASPTLQAREQRALTGYADALADLFARETGAPRGDVGARTAANAMVGVHRALIDYVRERVLAGDRLDGLAVDVRRCSDEAFALLGDGLGDYGRVGPA